MKLASRPMESLARRLERLEAERCASKPQIIFVLFINPLYSHVAVCAEYEGQRWKRQGDETASQFESRVASDVGKQLRSGCALVHCHNYDNDTQPDPTEGMSTTEKAVYMEQNWHIVQRHVSEARARSSKVESSKSNRNVRAPSSAHQRAKQRI